MFDNFPKVRPELPKEIKDIYAKHYKSNRDGDTTAASLAQKMESWLHKQVASDIVILPTSSDSPKITLELGAGTLNHLNYESTGSTYDVVEPFKELYMNSPHLKKIRNIYTDISDVPIESCYDRIISIATLEHICNLPEVIARSGLLLSNNGVFRSSIPNEGKWPWTLAWKLTTGLEFKLKHGLDYGILMKHEHVNTADEIEEVLRYFFKDVQYKKFGLSKTIALYRYYECRYPRVALCRDYLD